MNNGKISVRYARTLFSYAKKEKEEIIVYKQLCLLTDSFSGYQQQLNYALTSPAVKTKEKIKLLETACGENISKCLSRFMEFLVENKREEYIYVISLVYQDLYRKENNVLKSDITSATLLSSDSIEKINKFISTTFNSTVEMNTTVNPNLIGGFIIDIQQNRLDASISGKLTSLKKTL